MQHNTYFCRTKEKMLLKSHNVRLLGLKVYS